MNRNWTPKSRVSVTDAGVIIEIELGGITAEVLRGLMITSEAGQLCIHGQQRDDRGSFECRFDVPSGYCLPEAKLSFANGILRIEVPKNSDAKPRSMMVYCTGCGKYFDIIIAPEALNRMLTDKDSIVTSKGPKNYRCSACGKAFDLDAFMKNAIEQSRKMGRKRGRR